MLYLPRLFVYHADAPQARRTSETFKVMERRLLKAIMNSVDDRGLRHRTAARLHGRILAGPLAPVKAVLALGLAALHGYLSRLRQDLRPGRQRAPAVFYRFLNEVPTVLMILIVLLVVLKPF